MTAVRATNAWWFVPMLFGVASLLAASSGVMRSGYVAADISSAGIGLCLTGPLLAAGTAYWFEGRTQWHAPLRTTRWGIQVLLHTGWPLLVGGPLTGCLAILVVARVLPTDAVSLRLLSVEFVGQLACAFTGMLMGWALPRVVAVPVAAMLTFVWFNYLVGTSSALSHNMTLTLDGFSQSSQPGSAAIAGALTLAGAVCVGAAGCLGLRSWDRTPRILAGFLALTTLATAVGASAFVVRASSEPLNLLASEPRTEPLSCSSRSGLTICLWPEAKDKLMRSAKWSTRSTLL